jgi:hypothetical protein
MLPRVFLAVSAPSLRLRDFSSHHGKADFQFGEGAQSQRMSTSSPHRTCRFCAACARSTNCAASAFDMMSQYGVRSGGSPGYPLAFDIHGHVVNKWFKVWNVCPIHSMGCSADMILVKLFSRSARPDPWSGSSKGA